MKKNFESEYSILQVYVFLYYGLCSDCTNVLW